MPYPIGRGVRVEVENALAAAKTVNAVTLADPGVATTTVAHAMTDGTVGFFSGVSGMVNLEQQAVRISSASASVFTLLRLKTTLFPAFTGTCSFTPISTWFTIGAANAYQVGGGEPTEIDQTVLLDDIAQITPGILAAQTVSITGFSEFQSAGMIKIVQAALDSTYLTFRITLKDGQQRVMRGIPSLPGEDMSVGASGTGQFTIKVTGRVLYLPAI
jgi:hypothetical protein